MGTEKRIGSRSWEITTHDEVDELTFVAWVAQPGSKSPQKPQIDPKALLAKAKNGDRQAPMWLGTGYEQGWFGKPDFQQALKWYSRAAAHGDPDAQNSLGQMYENGEGVQQD